MHDFDFDVIEKKRTARGARNKKCGSKSTRCTMPSDYLTPAEKKALNGPVTEVKLNQPMELETYLGLSDSLKVEYIKYLQDHYNANWVMIGQMLKCRSSEVCKEAQRLGVKALKRCYDKALIEERQAAWDAFCNGEVKQEAAPVEELPVMELEKKAPVGDDVSALADTVLAEIHPRVPDSNLSHMVDMAWRVEKLEDCLDSMKDKLERACTEGRAEAKGFDMEAAKTVCQAKRIDMNFQGWPDELTMTILRNMFRDQNVKVRISAEVVLP